MRAHLEANLAKLMNNHQVPGHGIEHMKIVANHAVEALKFETLTSDQKLYVEIAALLHDADDAKIFNNHANNDNARKLLYDAGMNESGTKLIIEMIDLVSCSKNGDREPPVKWMAIPRDCDRLEAIGEIGIDRCKQVTDHIKIPYHLPSTLVVRTSDELWEVASMDRFRGYSEGLKSMSMIDHYYDKLLHIGKPELLKSQNPYILREAAERTQLMVQFVLNYWKNS